MITEALRHAETEYVVYFLLTAYVEALDHLDPPRSSLPPRVKRLPVAGPADLDERIATVCSAIGAFSDGSQASAMLKEVLDVFHAAAQRLRTLPNGGPRWSWNVVERSQLGHERRRRLAWQMTDREAAEWAQKNGTQLERVASVNAGLPQPH